MAKSPDPRHPARHSNKDPAKPTRAKAAREHTATADPALERLLNPGIEKGTAGVGSGTGLATGTGLKPPPDNSFERRADRRGEHTARKSVAQAFEEAPQRGYVGSGSSPLDVNTELAEALGYGSDPSKPLINESRRDFRHLRAAA